MSIKQKYRKVSTHIWNDQKFRALSERAKLSFLFIITHPHMTPLGAIRANLPGLAFELGMDTQAFTEAFAEVLAQGMAKHDEKGLLIWFPNFLRHNPPESPNVVKSWVGGYHDLPECDLKNTLIKHAACTVDGLSQGFREAFFEAFGQVCPQPSPNQEQEQEQEQEGKKEESTPPPDGEGPASSVSEPSESDTGEDADAGSPDQSPKVPPCPYGKIASIYNAKLPQLAQVRDMTDTRRRVLQLAWRARAERQSLAWWEGYFDAVAQLPFLLGENDRGWRADFDWLLKTKSMLGVFEGKYQNTKPAAGQKAPAGRAGNSVTEHNQGVAERLMQQG